MNICELTASITAIAIAVSKQLGDNDLALAAALFTQLGDTLATIEVSRNIGTSKNPDNCRKNID